MPRRSDKRRAARAMNFGTPEQRSRGARALAEPSAGARALNAKRTPEERSAAARKAVRARWRRVRAAQRAAEAAR